MGFDKTNQFASSELKLRSFICRHPLCLTEDIQIADCERSSSLADPAHGPRGGRVGNRDAIGVPTGGYPCSGPGDRLPLDWIACDGQRSGPAATCPAIRSIAENIATDIGPLLKCGRKLASSKCAVRAAIRRPNTSGAKNDISAVNRIPDDAIKSPLELLRAASAGLDPVGFFAATHLRPAVQPRFPRSRRGHFLGT